MANIPYRTRTRIILDRDTAFQVAETGRLDDYNRTREDPEAFRRTMNFVAPRSVLIYDKKAREVRVYARDG